MGPEEIIKKLNLIPLADEGGYYRQTWISDNDIEGRPSGTAIYFLLVNSFKGFSALHTLSTTEIYHFYLGDPFELSLFYKNGEVRQIIMGNDILQGELPQYIVPAGVIQGSRIVTGGEFALIGTTMIPGFIFDDLKIHSREKIIKMYPENRDLIISLTRE